MTDQTPPKDVKKDSGGKRQRKRKPLPDDRFDWRKASRTLTFWILLVLVSWILFRQLNLNEKPEVHKSFTQYRKLLESGQVDGAEVIDREFHGRLKDGGAIVANLPFIDDKMLSEWDSLKIDYQFREKTTSWLGLLVTSILPWIVFIAIWLYVMRRMQGGGSRGVFSFGKSKAKLSMEGKPKMTFNDVAGCDEAKQELQEVIAFLREPKKFAKLGGRIPKGALLLGPPGTGKTLLARAVAGEAEVPFFSMSGADFVEMFVGVGAARVRDLFETGKKHAPCILFIDEIDAVGRHRGAGLGGGHDEREQTLNQLLVEMDGFESNEGVILLAATNRPDVLDPALTRPGRFDRQIVVDRPDVRGREGIFGVHTRNIPLAADVRLDVLAKGTPGLAGADLANLVNEAALLAARRNATQVAMSDFEEAKDKVMMGAERKSMLISEDEKRQTAYHEAGHVLVAKLTPGADPVHKVTIIPRGRALGLTHYLPLDEKHNYSRGYLRQTLTHLLGGRVAEKIAFSEFSTGAGNDIERATDIARRMVCEWGMSDRMGPIAFGRKQEEIFLGREISQHRDFSERTAQEIDAEVRRIVVEAEKNADRILRDNLDKLKTVAEALLEREILDGEEIDILLRGGKLPPFVRPPEPPPPRPPQQPPQRQRPRGEQRRGSSARRGDGGPPAGQRGDAGHPPFSSPPAEQGGRSGGGQRGQRARTDSGRGEGGDAGRSSTARTDIPRIEVPSGEARADAGRTDTPRNEVPRGEGQRSEAERTEEGRVSRGRQPGDASKSPGRMRRDFARSYGVASSRDPENRRPTPMEIARMQGKPPPRADQPPKQETPQKQDESPRPEPSPKAGLSTRPEPPARQESLLETRAPRRSEAQVPSQARSVPVGSEPSLGTRLEGGSTDASASDAARRRSRTRRPRPSGRPRTPASTSGESGTTPPSAPDERPDGGSGAKD